MILLLDAPFVLTIGSFMPAIEVLCLQLCWGAFLLTIEAFLLRIGALLKQAECEVWNGGGWIRQISAPEFWNSGPDISEDFYFKPAMDFTANFRA